MASPSPRPARTRSYRVCDGRYVLESLRYYLWAAGVRRSALHEGSEVQKAMTWHDLRATGLTWMAIRVDDPLKIKQRAGHASFSTTEMYIRTAEAVRDGFGEVFPPLPAALLSPDESSRESSGGRAKGSKSLLRGQDLNLRPSGYEATDVDPNRPESQAIVTIVVPDSVGPPTRNLAIHGAPEAADDTRDDSIDLEHVLALLVAAHALVFADPRRARELLSDLMRLLRQRTP